ncbi:MULTISPECIES: NADP-dependent oxidoreductase [Agrobacterium]|uniref:NADP-dependent oxidoreductase n=1 Tax=Agrobacterium tumefaciens TaxID=358 RepID=A0AAE6BIF0_AGRTU|nr:MULTISPECIES: NADP-dependent oxidoreductase [Agrobacterium]QCL77039.1 NADP-dependent oxidoreductase [Agrobacterium tumefaciens]QCL82546.1 NADP-dependent oxidoreductase [Agrobacterium tumefaciens]CUX71064.1 Alcohol dehydrogenase zinc-binding domain protein [Agrobacterium sp. NCPPB 925]
MKAFIVDSYGKREHLRAGDVPEPELGADEVLIEAHASAVNLIDAKVRNVEFKLILPYRTPFILGHDVAGVVVRVGSRVSQFKVGDEVYARPRDLRIGTFAEFVAVNEDTVALKPRNISMEEAASIPLVGLSAWQALFEKAKLQTGQKVFTQAGSGGVGTFAIQLAKHLGATVATATSAGNAALVKDMGADVVIDYRKDAFEDRLRDYDVVLNSQDEKTSKKSLGVPKPGDHVVSITAPPDLQFGKDIKASWPVRQLFRALGFSVRRKARRLGLNYTFLFMRGNGSQLRQIASLIEVGVIRPVIDKVFPFESTNEALAYVESGRAKGKVVIRMR